MNKSLKNSITLKIGLVLAVILAIIFTLIVIDFRHAEIKASQNKMKQLIINVSNKVNANNKRVIKLVKTMAKYQEVGGFNRPQESIRFLRKVLTDNPRVLGTYFIYKPEFSPPIKQLSKQSGYNSNGWFAPYWYRTKTGIKLDSVTGIKESKFYQIPRQINQPSIIEPFVYQRLMMTSFVTPIRINNRFYGVAGVDYSLNKFQKLLNKANFFDTGELYLLSSNQKIIGTTKSSDLLAKSAAKINNYQSLLASLTDFSQVEVRSSSQLDKFVASAPIKKGNWQLILTVERKEVLTQVNHSTLILLGLGSLIVIVLSGLLYWLVACSLVPLAKATDFAQEIARGNLEVERMKVESEKEVGKLKQALNKMRNRLQGMVGNLVEEKNKLARYFEISEVMIFSINQAGKIVEVNQKSCEVLGYREKEILGKKWTELVDEQGEKKLSQAFVSLPAGQVSAVNDVQSEIITKSGERRKILWTANIVKDKAGNLKRVLVSGKDITRYELLKEELEYNKLQVKFFANLSHELKTPLNLIFSSLQVLDSYQKDNFEPQTYQQLSEYTGIIRQNGYRLLRLVNNLVDITKINSNSFTLNLKNADIVKTIKEITYSVENYIETKDKVLEFNCSVDERIIACDPFSIERIMLNLLSNAIKFTDSGDKISVNLSVEGDMVLISVLDTGRGIPEKKQNLIFKQFRQVDKSFNRNKEGTGIGLALVKLLVELHEGEITVNSEYGEFTEFNIRLPDYQLTDQEAENFNRKSDDSTMDRVEVEFSDIYEL